MKLRLSKLLTIIEQAMDENADEVFIVWKDKEITGKDIANIIRENKMEVIKQVKKYAPLLEAVEKDNKKKVIGWLRKQGLGRFAFLE